MSNDDSLFQRRLEAGEISAVWDDQAADWIAWARAPDHDSYWRFHRAQFFELVPAAGRATLDVGCGEGRVTRDLHALGHRVVAIDRSDRMIAAARESSPELEFHVADAAALPFADATFDLVIAFMSLQDMENMPTAVAECARVLEPGGRFCLAVVHPLNSAGRFASREADAPFVIDGSYLDESPYVESLERDGLEMTFVSVHRPLQSYANALDHAGLAIERIREPSVPRYPGENESTARWRRLPLFLHVRARKSA